MKSPVSTVVRFFLNAVIILIPPIKSPPFFKPILTEDQISVLMENTKYCDLVLIPLPFWTIKHASGLVGVVN